MSTTKTVNVTTGKVLHYTIKKAGYKPVSGSKLITDSETINVNMIPESSSDGVYTFGDRIGGVASFFGYFDSVNPNTQATQKYACFVLDAQYRTSGKIWYNSSTPPSQTVIPRYGSSAEALAATESATYNTQAIIDALSPVSGRNYEAFYWARNPNGQSLIISVDGNSYVPQLPNIKEVSMIYNFKSQLDALDPTLSSYSSMSLDSWTFTNGGVWGSTAISFQHYGPGSYDRYGEVNNWYGRQASDYKFGVVPVFEIPVN